MIEVNLKHNTKPTTALVLRDMSTTKEYFRVEMNGKVIISPDIDTSALQNLQTPYLQFLQEIIYQELQKDLNNGNGNFYFSR